MHVKEIWPADPSTGKVLRAQPAVDGRRYRGSCFCFPFELRGRRYLFHTLTRQCVQVDGTSLPQAPFAYDAGNGNHALRQLIEQRFFVPVDQDECALYEGTLRVLRKLRQRNRLHTYTILPTTACNARCVYCFEEGMPVETMSPQTVEETIAFILRTHDSSRRIRLSWFGGEPLVAADIISRICAAMAAADVDFESTMITNGSLINRATTETMAGLWRMKHVQLSMDCAEQEYIRRKNYRVYHDEYHTVMASVNLLTARGIDVTVRCNVDEDNISYMDDFIQDLSRVVTDRSRVFVYFLPLYDIRLLNSSDTVWAACAAAELKVESAGFTASRAGRVRRLKQVFCMAESTYEAVVIAPDGRLYNCEHCPEANVLGNIREGVVNRAFQERCTEVEPAREQCRDCVFLPECMTYSGCAVRSAICKRHQRAWMERALADEVTRAESKDTTSAGESGPDVLC